MPRCSRLVLASLALAACDTSVHDTDASGVPDAGGTPDVSAKCIEALDHSDLAWIQDNIFTPTCANFSVCHQSTAPQAAGLNLEPGNSEANLVDRVAVSDGVQGMNLIVVVAGDQAGSYLMTLIDHESKGGRLSGVLPKAGTMPFNNPLMCVEKRDAIGRWIDSL